MAEIDEVDALLSIDLEVDAVSYCPEASSSLNINCDIEKFQELFGRLHTQEKISVILLLVPEPNVAAQKAVQVLRGETCMKGKTDDALIDWANSKCDTWKEEFIEALYVIQRNDLLLDCQVCKHLVGEHHRVHSKLDPVRKLLYRVCENLDESEVKQLVQFVESSCHKQDLRHRDCSILEFHLLNWLDYKYIESRNGGFSKLCEQLITMERKDLAALLEGFTFANKSESNKTEEIPPSASPLPLPQKLNPDMYYKMTSLPRGLCVIINQREFLQSPRNLKDRQGTDVDRDLLKMTFEVFGFRTFIRENQTLHQMRQLMSSLSHFNHKPFDAFILCIMSHGEEDCVMGADGEPLRIREIKSTFSGQHCPTLVGKPKMIVVQACQGTSQQHAVTHHDIESDDVPSPPEHIPDKSDFLLGLATIPGYASFRSRTRGSWYITELCSLMAEHGRNEDMLSILTMVNNNVSKKEALMTTGPRKQMPEPSYTLRKKLQLSVCNEEKLKELKKYLSELMSEEKKAT